MEAVMSENQMSFEQPKPDSKKYAEQSAAALQLATT
jgi:hypothetical protein